MLKCRMLIFLAIGLLIHSSGMVLGAPPKSGEALLAGIKEEINQTPKDADVQLFKLVGNFLANVKLPQASKRIFNTKLAMRNIKILTTIPKDPFIRSGIGFTGSMLINKIQMIGTMYVLLDSSMRPQFSLTLFCAMIPPALHIKKFPN